MRKDQCVGHWLHPPFRHGPHHCHNHTNEDACSDLHSDTGVAPSCCFVPPPGSVIYTVLPDGAAVPQGTVIYGPPPPSAARPLAPGSVIYGPPPIGSQFVYGPPPAQLTVPILHCNVPAHHDLEKDMNRLEEVIDHLQSRQQKEKKTKARLLDDIEDLRRERESLKGEVEEFHRSGQKRKSRVAGHLDSLITELDLERSLQHHDSIDDEIECVETTLVKRRAELREADRLLAEAEDELKNTQEKTADLADKYNSAKEHLSQTERDAEELERRAQETAMNLVKADQQLRVLQTNARDLEQHRASQENTLQEINSVVSARDADFQSLSNNIQVCNDRLQKLQDDIQLAEQRGDLQLQALQETEDLLIERTTSLERLNCQISARQEEVVALDRLLAEKKEELHLLQDHIEQKEADLKDVMRVGELELTDKRQEIKELKSLLNNLCVQKGDLSAQLNEKRSQLAALTQEVAQEEDNLQRVSSQIHKQKSELKYVLEMQQLEDNELQGLKLQHEQKISDLEKTQALLLQGKLELENLQRTSQRFHSDMGWQRQLLEKDHQEIELLMTQMHTLQEKVETLSTEKKNLEKSGQELEQKLTRNRKALDDTEERNREAAAALEKLQSSMRTLEKEVSQLSQQRETLRQETGSTLQLLEEKREELHLLRAQVTQLKGQLGAAEQDLRNATKHRDDVLTAMKEDTADAAAKYKRLEEEEQRKEERLRQLERATEEAAHNLAKQEGHLQQITKDIAAREEQLRDTGARLEEERERLEQQQQSILGMMSQKVSALEERALTLEQEGRCCALLEESLNCTRERLREKTNEVLLLQKEMEVSRKDLSDFRDQVTAERRRDEKRVAMLKEAINNQRILSEEASAEQKRENSNLKKQLMMVEQAAYDNRERANRLLKELKQLEAEHAALRRELKSQEDLDRRQQEVNEAVKELKAQVKAEIHSTLQDLRCAEDDGLAEDVGDLLEQKPSLQSQLDSLTESFPFSANPASKDRLGRGSCQDEHWRGDALREKLRQHEDRLKAELHQRMSKQADVLSQGRQQTEGRLRSLKRRVDALDELVGNLSSDAASHSQALSMDDLHILPRQTYKPSSFSSSQSPLREGRI